MSAPASRRRVRLERIILIALVLGASACTRGGTAECPDPAAIWVADTRWSIPQALHPAVSKGAARFDRHGAACPPAGQVEIVSQQISLRRLSRDDTAFGPPPGAVLTIGLTPTSASPPFGRSAPVGAAPVSPEDSWQAVDRGALRIFIPAANAPSPFDHVSCGWRGGEEGRSPSASHTCFGFIRLTEKVSAEVSFNDRTWPRSRWTELGRQIIQFLAKIRTA
jgi:hypothetical protein